MELNKKFNKRYATISLYVIATAVAIYILALIATNFPVIVSRLMEKIGWVLGVSTPIILGFAISYLLCPVVDYFEQIFSKIKIKKKSIKTGRTLGVVATVLLLILFITGLISILVYTVTDQIRLANFDDIYILAESYKHSFDNFYVTILNTLDKLNIQSEGLSEYVNTGITYVLNTLKAFVAGTAASVTNITSHFTTFIFAFIIAIYFILDGKIIGDYLKKVGFAIFNEKINKRIHTFIKDADQVFSGYIRGQLMDAFIMMVAISSMLSIVGVKFGMIIGILAGIGNLVPYCGPFVAYAGTILVCLLNGDMRELIIACILLLVIQTIDGNIIAPKLLSNSIKIHPVLVIIFIIFGSAIGGLLGMLLAVPVGALVKVIFARFIDFQVDKKKQKLKDNK